MIFASIAEWNSLFIFVTIGRFDITCHENKKKRWENKFHLFEIMLLNFKRRYKKDKYFIVLQ